MQLEKDLKEKEEQLERMQELNESNLIAIRQLNTENLNNKQTIANLQLRVQKTPREVKKIDFGESEANKAEREELFSMLQTRTEELDQAICDFQVVEETCKILDAEKMQLLEEVEKARELFEKREQEFIEQSQQLMQLQAQMEEVQEERARQAQQQMRDQIKDNFGMTAESQVDGRSGSSHSSFTENTSQFTALKTLRNQAQMQSMNDNSMLSAPRTQSYLHGSQDIRQHSNNNMNELDILDQSMNVAGQMQP